MDKAERVFEKIAKEKDPLDYYLGGSIVGGAGLGLGSSAYRRGDLTGRETLYHATSKDNVKSIKEKGILKSKANDPESFTRKALNVRGDISSKELNDKVYMARKKRMALDVGSTRKLHGKGKQKVLKARVPSWKLNEVKNPESKNINIDNIDSKGTATFSDDISPKYIKGSDKYKSEGLKEIKDFITKNPKKFTKGLGKAVGGLGLLGAGISIINKGKEDG